MLNTIQLYAPSTWTSSNQCELASHCEEHQQLAYELRRAISNVNIVNPTIVRLIRVQDLHAYGQFLIREQLLLNTNMDNQLFRVRRYIQVNRAYINEIIKYNLDPRRCGMGQSLTFSKRVFNNSGNLIVVVKVLTTEHSADQIIPETSCDFYVEYVIETRN